MVGILNLSEYLGILCNSLINCIYCNFLKDVQLGLYLFGPGGTGKTTFIYTLLYILGPDAAHTTTLNALIKRAVWVKSS